MDPVRRQASSGISPLHPLNAGGARPYAHPQRQAEDWLGFRPSPAVPCSPRWPSPKARSGGPSLPSPAGLPCLLGGAAVVISPAATSRSDHCSRSPGLRRTCRLRSHVGSDMQAANSMQNCLYSEDFHAVAILGDKSQEELYYAGSHEHFPAGSLMRYQGPQIQVLKSSSSRGTVDDFPASFH